MGRAYPAGITFQSDSSRLGAFTSTIKTGGSAASNATALTADIAAASAAGGGVVFIPAGTYQITGPIALKSGVTIEGVRPQLASGSVLVSGTILDGVDNATTCFTYNATDAGGDYANAAAMYADLIFAPGLRNLGFKRFVGAVRMGALYKAGSFYGLFENLYVTNWTGWAFWFENTSYGRFNNLWCRNMVSGGTPGDCGGIMWAASNGYSTGPQYVHGNHRIDQIFIECGNPAQVPLARGICFRVRGTVGTRMNDNHCTKLGTNGSSAARSETVNIPTGTDITVADSSLWPVDLPLTVTGSIGGLNPNITYFVLTSAANVITLSDTIRGTAKSLTGGGASGTIRTYGYPCLEVVATDENVNNVLQPGSYIGMDMEGIASLGVLVQDATGEFSLHTALSTQGTDCINTWCFRNSVSGSYKSAASFTADHSSAFNGIVCLGGTVNNLTTAFPNNVPVGFWYQGSPLRWTQNWAVQPSSNKTGSMRCESSTVGAYNYPAIGMGQRVSTWSSAAKAFTTAESGSWAYTGGATTATLPTLIGAIPNSATATVTGGMTFEIVNAGSGTLTLNTNGTDLINNIAAKTSLSIAAGAGCTLRAQTNGTTPFWVVVGAWGTVT